MLIPVFNVVLILDKDENANNNGKHFVLFTSEAVVQRCSVKNVFLEISQNSQESICAKFK